MTSANIEFFYDNGAKIGSAADYLRSAVELLEIESTVGEVNIFGETETKETIAKQVALRKDRAMGAIKKVTAALTARYSIEVRTLTKGMLGTPKTTVQAYAVMDDGEFLSYVKPDQINQALNALNKQDAEEKAYIAQFATEEDWMQHLDENAAG